MAGFNWEKVALLLNKNTNITDYRPKSQQKSAIFTSVVSNIGYKLNFNLPTTRKQCKILKLISILCSFL